LARAGGKIFEKIHLETAGRGGGEGRARYRTIRSLTAAAGKGEMEGISERIVSRTGASLIFWKNQHGVGMEEERVSLKIFNVLPAIEEGREVQENGKCAAEKGVGELLFFSRRLRGKRKVTSLWLPRSQGGKKTAER